MYTKAKGVGLQEKVDGESNSGARFTAVSAAGVFTSSTGAPRIGLNSLGPL